MAQLISTVGRFDVPYGQVQLYSQLMAPNHGQVPIIGHVEGRGETLEVLLRMVIDGDWQVAPFHHRIWTASELADAWEVAHHQHHGYDPRGLDPREGPTRLRLR